MNTIIRCIVVMAWLSGVISLWAMQPTLLTDEAQKHLSGVMGSYAARDEDGFAIANGQAYSIAKNGNIAPDERLLIFRLHFSLGALKNGNRMDVFGGKWKDAKQLTQEAVQTFADELENYCEDFLPPLYNTSQEQFKLFLSACGYKWPRSMLRLGGVAVTHDPRLEDLISDREANG